MFSTNILRTHNKLTMLPNYDDEKLNLGGQNVFAVAN